MYEFLEGRVAASGATRLVIDVGGVGYALAVPVGMGLAEGATARVYTHLVVRQDDHLLFGFRDRATRQVFRLLLSVRGVGPTAAIAILSGLSCEELVDTVAREDTGPLTRVKGIGKKTAQQILLDLSGRIGQLDPSFADRLESSAAPSASPAVSGLQSDAEIALVSIGFSEKEARKSVERALSQVPEDETPELERLVRAALKG